MVNLFEQELSKLNFLKHENYNVINEAYNVFIQKIMSAIDKDPTLKIETGETKLSGMV